jgi:flagellar basal-body rod modification protein FlgD
MIAKTGTKTFTDNQNAAPGKGDGVQSMSAKDKQKLMGDAEIGDYLNKVADPNWVDPNKKMRAVGSNQLGKDAFMKLMLEQMKNQDPTDPVKHHEMAAQLAQFSSLEQLVNVNQNLEGMKQQQSPQHNFQALSFIGKTVSGDANRIIRTDGDKQHTVHFNLLNDAKEVNVEIADINGNVVKKLAITDPKKGENEILWDGVSENGQATRGGEYRVKIEAKNDQGKKVGLETKFEGKVSGVNLTAEGPVLLVGNKSVRLSEVKKIVDEVQMEEKKQINMIPNANVKEIKNDLKERDIKPTGDLAKAMEGKPLPLVNTNLSEEKRGLPL